MLTCNPDDETHWLYRRFHPDSPDHRKPTFPERDPQTGEATGRVLSYADLGYTMYEMSSLENQFLAEDNRRQLLAHDASFLRRYVHGRWGIPEGAIHVVPQTSLIPGSLDILQWLRQTCTLYRFLDHGDSSPTCCLWMAVDGEGNCYFYREYYLPNALISTHRANITALSAGETYADSQADPSIFFRLQRIGAKPSDLNTEQGGRWAVSDEYADVTVQAPETALYWTPAENNELGTRSRINEYLLVDPTRLHPITRQLGAPRLYFVQANANCPQGIVHALRETRGQRRVKIGVDLGRPQFSDQRDPAIIDHAYDVVRYGIASRPSDHKDAVVSVEGTFRREQQRAQTFHQQMRRRTG